MSRSFDGTHDGGDGRATLVAVGFAIGLIVLAIARLAIFGWAGLAPDDARYIFVGLSVLDGHGPVTPTGNLFLLRAPVYGIALAAGRPIADGEPIAGARIVAVILTVMGLLAAVRLAWTMAGPVAAVGTTVAIVTTPLIWRLLPTLRVDLPQTAGVVAVLLALHRPTMRRWALAGALLGVTILVKETILLLAFAPLAFVRTVPRAWLMRLSVVFLGAAAIVAGWWWIVVWTQSGSIFPLNAVGVIERRDVGADLRLDTFGAGLLAIVAIAWAVVLAGARRDRGLRLLTAAAACLIPPAAYATLSGLNARNYAGLAVLSSIAVGVAVAKIVAQVLANPSISPRAGRSSDTFTRGTARPAVGMALLAGLLTVGIAGPIVAQARVGNPEEPALPGTLASWLRGDSAPGSRAVMTFRFSDVVALNLYDTVSAPGLPAVRVDPDASLADFVWIGLRDRQLFGYRRADWVETLGAPETGHLVLAGPHPLTPAELVPTLDRGEVPGFELAASFREDGDWASIYRVEPAAVALTAADVPLHLSPAAANAWLDQAVTASGGSVAARTEALAGSGAIVVGPDTAALAARISGSACLTSLNEAGSAESRIVPVAECRP